MGILKKLTTLTRGIARESAEVIIDDNAIRIFEQEIVDVERTISSRKKMMSEMLVTRKQLERECESIQGLITKREAQAQEFLHKNDKHELIDEIAEDIARYEEMLAGLQMQRDSLSKRIFNTEAALRKALSEVVQYRRDLRLAKAQQIVKNAPAKSGNLPKQLSELENTRQHIAGLQGNDNDQEAGWVEMEEMLDLQSIDKKIHDIDRRKRKEAVLARIKEASSAT